MLRDFLREGIAKEFFEKTFEHPLLGSKTQWVPALWLLQLANQEVSESTNTAGADGQPDRLIKQAELFESIRVHGMRDPFLLGVGRFSRKVRLEAGNHRVQVLLGKGIIYVPAIAYVGDSQISYPVNNGAHEGIEWELKIPRPPIDLGNYPIKVYERITDVLKDPPAYDHPGF